MAKAYRRHHHQITKKTVDGKRAALELGVVEIFRRRVATKLARAISPRHPQQLRPIHIRQMSGSRERASLSVAARVAAD
jgi:hypothetical protein